MAARPGRIQDSRTFRPRVEAGLGQATGLKSDQVGKLLTMLAPVLLGTLGKAQKQQGLDSGALAGLLGGERQSIERDQPQAGGLMGMLLDADGDGDVELDDVASKGLGLLGKLFKR